MGAIRRLSGLIGRLAALGMVWFGALVVANYAFMGTSDNWERFIGVILPLLIGALSVSDVVLRYFADTAPQKSNRREATGGAENLRLRDMMGLLDDLRGELRESLRERIRNLSAAEVDSFDDLLADASAKRKRR